MKPYYAVEVDGGAISDSLAATVVRPLNAVSYATLVANDRKGVNFISNIDLFESIDIYADWVDGTTKIFSGIIESVEPERNQQQGEILTAKARGLGRALLLTCNNKTYGVESYNPTIEDPSEIWTDIVDNFINKSFGGAATGYSITKNINVRASPNINYLCGSYRSNIDLINEVCQIRQADEGAATASDQWLVDVDGELHIKAVDESQTGWSKYWDSTTVAPTLVEGTGIHLSNFSKTLQEYANKILYIGKLRKPATDVWTESTTGWADDDVTLTADTCGDAGEPYIYGTTTHGVMVGTYALKAASEVDGTCYFYYDAPSYWDFSKIGSAQSIPTLNFFLACTDISDSVQIGVNLYTTRGTDFYAYIDNIDASSRLHKHLAKDLEWTHFSIPIGPYALGYLRALAETGGALPYQSKWGTTGSPSWANINGIEFQFDGTADRDTIFIDDLHFSGLITRCAYNSTAIAAYNEVQKIIVDDTAHDDTMAEGTPGTTDIGTCALLAKGELMRCQTVPTLGSVTFTYGRETLLPGQVFHIHGRYTGAAYKINSNFRATKVTHMVNKNGFMTVCDVTDDVLTSFPKTVPEQASIISRYAVSGHRDAKNLKAGTVDVAVQFLSEDYA